MAGPSSPRLLQLEELELTPRDGFDDIPLESGFILDRIKETATDRRLSKELGGKARLSESFDRVKNEHAESDVDWGFWGAVVQDYEAVARTQPAELAAAIQKGIPDVIRYVLVGPTDVGVQYGNSCRRPSRPRSRRHTKNSCDSLQPTTRRYEKTLRARFPCIHFSKRRSARTACTWFSRRIACTTPMWGIARAWLSLWPPFY